jgi:hypothetical protein
MPLPPRGSGVGALFLVGAAKVPFKETPAGVNRRPSQYCGLRRLSSVAIEASFGGKLVNSEIARAN